MIFNRLHAHQEVLIFSRNSHQAVTNLLEARHDVPGDGADQSCNVIHEALWETVLPGWLQALREVEVVDNALHLWYKARHVVMGKDCTVMTINRIVKVTAVYRWFNDRVFFLPWVQRKTRPVAEPPPWRSHCSLPTAAPTPHGRAEENRKGEKEWRWKEREGEATEPDRENVRQQEKYHRWYYILIYLHAVNRLFSKSTVNWTSKCTNLKGDVTWNKSLAALVNSD